MNGYWQFDPTNDGPPPLAIYTADAAVVDDELKVRVPDGQAFAWCGFSGRLDLKATVQSKQEVYMSLATPSQAKKCTGDKPGKECKSFDDAYNDKAKDDGRKLKVYGEVRAGGGGGARAAAVRSARQAAPRGGTRSAAPRAARLRDRPPPSNLTLWRPPLLLSGTTPAARRRSPTASAACTSTTTARAPTRQSQSP